MISAIQTALSGLTAASKKADAAASNVANLDTVGSLTDPAHPPYTPVETQQTAIAGGVQSQFVSKNPPFVPAYDPSSPFADQNGEVGVPNVDLSEEMVNLQIAKFTYAANAKVVGAESDMEKDLLNSIDTKA